MEFLRVASGEAATSLAVLRGDEESLTPRARALMRLAVTLTAEPWALTADAVAEAARQGLDAGQVEAAVGVVSMFNYFTRVADATGIEFDYETPLPAFEPDRRQEPMAPRPDPAAPRPDPATGPDPAGHGDDGARRPRHQPLQAAWASWRAYVLETDDAQGPLTRRERRLLAAVAAEQTGDWAGAEALGGAAGGTAGGDEPLAGFARKLSREPWRMEPADLEKLRAAGYQETAVLHAISVVAHQNAHSRLVIGLQAADRVTRPDA